MKRHVKGLFVNFVFVDDKRADEVLQTRLRSSVLQVLCFSALIEWPVLKL